MALEVVMSKERELLVRIVEANMVQYMELMDEAEELLAQPELSTDSYQLTEQAPVAWMYDHHIAVGHDKYTEFNIVETCARNLESENCINVRPLYLAPPKREQKPLTRQQISEGNQSMLNVTRDAFVNGAKWAEKAHGITGENDE
jgi:hypothetical protein